VDVDVVERIVARMARIPEKQANASDKGRLKTLEESLKRVVFGQDEAVHAVAQSIKRARAGLGQPDRPAGSFLFTGQPASARPSWPSSSRSTSGTSSSASTCPSTWRSTRSPG